MNAFGSDQMLLPSITQILEHDIKTLNKPLLSDDDSLRPTIPKATPKMLTPPASPIPILSELTTPPYLLRMASHDGSQMLPSLEPVCEVLEMGLHSGLLQPFENLESLNHITELEHLHARDIMSSTSTQSDEMFDDNDSGSDWPGIYIDDNDDTIVPSPTPSAHFDAPCFYESSDLNTIDSLLVYPEPVKSERRKYNSIGTDESLQSDSGSDGGSCCPSLSISSRPFHSHHGHHTSKKSKSASRTHNYKRRTILKSLEELREEGSKTVIGLSSLPPSSSSSSSTVERRKRGRPRKRLSGELGERGSRRKNTRKAVKGSHLWEFILEMLKNEAYCPQYIKWEDKDDGVFRIVNSKVVASMWGEIKNNPRMTYEKLSRAMR